MEPEEMSESEKLAAESPKLISGLARALGIIVGHLEGQLPTHIRAELAEIVAHARDYGDRMRKIAEEFVGATEVADTVEDEIEPEAPAPEVKLDVIDTVGWDGKHFMIADNPFWLRDALAIGAAQGGVVCADGQFEVYRPDAEIQVGVAGDFVVYLSDGTLTVGVAKSPPEVEGARPAPDAPDENIDTSDIPEAGEEFFANAIRREPKTAQEAPGAASGAPGPEVPETAATTLGAPEISPAVDPGDLKPVLPAEEPAPAS